MAQVSGGPGARPSSWAVGFTFFAAFMMIMIGAFQMIAGLAAIFENEFFVVTQKYAFEVDVTAWGWIHLLIGLLLLSAGFGLYSGAVWARTVGVIMAIISAIANFLFLPYYPVWSILMIVIDITVIWALTAHGRDITANE
jgi:hypothetical protein